jgi:hypothetical protein
MIRPLFKALTTLMLSIAAALLLVVTAVLVAAVIVTGGLYLALWGQKNVSLLKRVLAESVSRFS